MICKYCKNEFQGNFCPNCGKAVNSTNKDVHTIVLNGKRLNTAANVPPAKKPFYSYTWFVLLMLCCCCFPVGIFLMWKYKKFNLPIRIIISSFFGLYCLTTMVSSMVSALLEPTTPTVLMESANQTARESTEEVAATTTETSDNVITPIYDFGYEITDGKLFLTDYTGHDEIVIISNEYEINGTTYSIEKAGESMFFNSYAKTVIFMEGITEIDHAIFNSCDVEKIYFPSTMNYVYDDSFAYLTESLTDIYYNGTEEDWAQIYTKYNPGTVSENISDNNYEGAGSALGHQVNIMIGHDFDLSSISMHYNATQTDIQN